MSINHLPFINHRLMILAQFTPEFNIPYGFFGRDMRGSLTRYRHCAIIAVVKRIAVAAIKGGVGKSTVTANLGLALKEIGFKVGFLDIDITGSTLSRALGIEPPRWELDTAREKVVVPEVNGYWLLAIASHVGEDYAVLWGRSHQKELVEAKGKLTALMGLPDSPASYSLIAETLAIVSREIDDILAQSKWRFVSELLSDEIVTWPQPLDFMLADLPPSTSDEMFSFLEQAKDLFGVVIVSQPAQIATIGLQRTIDLLRVRQVPIVGLVANQDGFLNCHGEIEYQFLSPRVDLQAMAKRSGIPFLISIPQTADAARVKPYFRRLAEKVVGSVPVVLKEVTLATKLKRKLVKGIARGISR